MITSMTGFGRCEVDGARAHVYVEIQTVNHRHLLVKPRMPAFCQSFAGDIERLLRTRLNRGTVHYTLRVRPHADTPLYVLDADVIRSYAEQLAQVGDVGLAKEDLSLKDLLALPGVVVERAPDAEFVRALWADLESAFTGAADEVVGMREREGAFLAEELRLITTGLAERVEVVRERAPEIVAGYRDRLVERMRKLMDGTDIEVDEAVIVRETATFAERSDITEEATRLAGHARHFLADLGRDGVVGRRLDFLAQEMFREASTMLSKVQDSDVAAQVVTLKTEIDKLREQVLNIE